MLTQTGLLFVIIWWITTAVHAQPQAHPRLTIQRQRVVQSCGAMLDAAHPPGSYLMSSIIGLTSIGTVQSASRSEALLGFWVPIPIILSADRESGDVTAGERTWTWPNPFRDNVQIEIQLSGSSAVEADIYDNIGQHVTTVPVSSLRDDFAVFSWNGASSLGHPCASGTYTVRIHVIEPLRQRRIMYSTTITRIR